MQLRNRLAESEKEQDVTLQEKNAALDDLHRRLKQNVDCIQQLNQQVCKYSLRTDQAIFVFNCLLRLPSLRSGNKANCKTF